MVKPTAGEPLQNPQEFLIEHEGEVPARVNFYLNGRLILGRKNPPFRFEIPWDTRFNNKVRVEALYPGRETVAVEREFEEIAVDFEQEVEAFQCFPFLENPLKPGGWRLIANSFRIEPQRFEPADRFEMSLVIALDVSGSMKYFLEDLSQPIHRLAAFAEEQGFRTQFLVFDRKPALISLDALPASLVNLFKGVGHSVIYDALATATDLFGPGPRRVVLLISDGKDDGSRHSVETARTYLKKSQAALIWLSPSNARNAALTELTRLSGGFTLYSEGRDPWSRLTQRLAHQYHLLAPGATFPIKINLSPGRIWYPRWDQ